MFDMPRVFLSFFASTVLYNQQASSQKPEIVTLAHEVKTICLRT